ncbi:hypothetical protein [Rhodopila sp.]|uniref:hypothetical protein n=1 Tax=Rhodopila sp. TaxID=2480087 RepID=UPI003D118E97
MQISRLAAHNRDTEKTSEKGSLTESDHTAMDKFLGTVLDAYKTDQVDRANAVSQLAQVIAAIDIRNIG